MSRCDLGAEERVLGINGRPFDFRVGELEDHPVGGDSMAGFDVDGLDAVGEEVFHLYDPRLSVIDGRCYAVFAADVPAEEGTYVSLFDGKTLEGWEKVGNERSVWEVKDGAISGSGPASMAGLSGARW